MGLGTHYSSVFVAGSLRFRRWELLLLPHHMILVPPKLARRLTNFYQLFLLCSHSFEATVFVVAVLLPFPTFRLLSVAGLCTSDASTTDDQCREALYNSSVVMGYGELLRYDLQIPKHCDILGRTLQ